MASYRILLADDHTIVRQGIKRILDEVADLEVTGEAKDGREALDILDVSDPDLAIVDIQMPRVNGLDVVQSIKKSHPLIKVIVLTMHKEKEYLNKALQLGADAFILKEDIDSVLLSAIAAVRRGQKYVSPLMSR